MVSRRIAQLSVLLFFLVLIPSISIVVSGSRHPQMFRPLARGERFSPISLADPSGGFVRLDRQRDRCLLLVYAPSGDIPASQRAWIAQFVDRVEATVPANVVVITHELNPTWSPTGICPTASSLLVDEGHILCRLLGLSSEGPSVCLIDSNGILAYRDEVPQPDAAASQLAGQDLGDLREITGTLLTVVHAGNPVRR